MFNKDNVPQGKLNPGMDTSQNIRHAFGCDGAPVHVNPGYKILRNGNRCPDCGREVTDITDTHLGQSYLAFARLDLGDTL